MMRALSIFLIVLSPMVSYGEIREIQSMNEILKEIDSNTLVVFDIDNTVLMPIGQLGSDQWYYYLVKRFQDKEKMTSSDAYKKADTVWYKTQNIIETKIVEPTNAKLIADLQITNHVMALTARNFDSANITHKQLASNNVDFTKNPPYKKSLKFNLESEARYQQGVLYQGEMNNKGLVLIEFLKRTKNNPKKIIFIDDKEKHTKNMNQALEDWGLKHHIEFRYGSADVMVKSFWHDFNNPDLLFNGTFETTASPAA